MYQTLCTCRQLALSDLSMSECSLPGCHCTNVQKCPHDAALCLACTLVVMSAIGIQYYKYFQMHPFFLFFTFGDISIAKLISFYFSLDCWVCTDYVITSTKYGPASPTWGFGLNLGGKFYWPMLGLGILISP